MRPLLSRYLTEIVALLVVTIWGANFVLVKAALDEWDVFAFTFLRYAGMLALAWGVVLWRGRDGRSRIAVQRRDLRGFALAGVFGYTLYMLLSIVGLDYTTAFSNALLLATAPIFVALLLHAFGLELVAGRQWLAMLVSLAGVVVFLSDKAADGFGNASLGDAISLAAALFFAGYAVANKPLLARYPAAQATAWTLTFGGLPVLAITAPALVSQDWTRISATGWATLVWATVVPVYLAWTLWSWVNHRDGVGRTAMFMYLVPIVGGGTSWLLLDEGFGPLKVGGAALTLAGLMLARRAARRPAGAPPSVPAGLRAAAAED